LKEDKPVEGKKSDPAHPSIYPTGNFQILSGSEKRIYDLIAKRFLSLFCEDAIVENKKISVKVEDLIFSTKGSEIRKKSWMQIYPTKLKEKELPDVSGKVKIIDSRIEEKETQPPKRYSPASILSELEKRNLGTKATRASILETLYDRNYIQDRSIKATPLGISLIESLEKHSPIIIDEALTRSFEQQMESIQEAKKNYEEKEEKIIEKAKKTITDIHDQFKKEEKEVGKELLAANLQLREQQREENTLNVCPVCKKGSLAITYSKKTRRQFVACNAYPKCRTTFSLPPNSSIKKEGSNCPECGFPRLISLKKGKKPWIFCFNPQCPTNRERIEEYRKKKELENNNS
jgi:DNA topoisomerase-1